MRIVCLSDTHTLTAGLQVPAGDVLVHAGDWCGSGDIGEAIGFLDWLETLPHAHKVIIAGNHDWIAEHQPELIRVQAECRGITYLCDSSVTIDGVRYAEIQDGRSFLYQHRGTPRKVDAVSRSGKNWGGVLCDGESLYLNVDYRSL